MNKNEKLFYKYGDKINKAVDQSAHVIHDVRDQWELRDFSKDKKSGLLENSMDDSSNIKYLNNHIVPVVSNSTTSIDLFKRDNTNDSYEMKLVEISSPASGVHGTCDPDIIQKFVLTAENVNPKAIVDALVQRLIENPSWQAKSECLALMNALITDISCYHYQNQNQNVSHTYHSYPELEQSIQKRFEIRKEKFVPYLKNNILLQNILKEKLIKHKKKIISNQSKKILLLLQNQDEYFNQSDNRMNNNQSIQSSKIGLNMNINTTTDISNIQRAALASARRKEFSTKTIMNLNTTNYNNPSIFIKQDSGRFSNFNFLSSNISTN